MGIYYDGNINMNQFNDIQAGAAPFSLRYDAVNDTTQALPQRLVSNEYPSGLLGAPPQPNANPPAAFRFAQSYYPIPAVYQWSFSVQQKLASSWVVEGDYVGSHTIHQFQFVDDNAPALPQGDLANVPLQNRRPYPQWGILGTWAPLGWARYNAGTAQRQEQPVAWADAAEQLELGEEYLLVAHRHFGPGEHQLPRTLHLVRRLRRSLRTGGSSTRCNYQTPKLAVHQGAAARRERLGVHRHLHGRDRKPRDRQRPGPDRHRIHGLLEPGAAEPDLQSELRAEHRIRSCSGSTPPASSIRPSACGATRRLGAVTDPGINNWNIATAKRIPLDFLKEGHALEFRGDFFNAWNHTQWLSSDKSMTSATYGRITSTHPARQVQFALRYLF